MKKIFLIPTLILTLFVTMNKVNADTILYSDFYDTFDTHVTFLNTYSTSIDNMISYWQSNYSSICPYYVITSNFTNQINLVCLNSVNFTYDNYVLSNDNVVKDNDNITYQINYNYSTNTYTYYPDYGTGGSISGVTWFTPSQYINSGLNIYKSNFNLIFKENTTYQAVNLPSYSDNNYNFPSYTINDSDVLPTVETLANSSYEPESTINYTEIDLNDYAYVILSLKSYNQSAFTTNIYTLGSLCLTPVYNYGMTDVSSILGNNYTVQNCTPVYSIYTPVVVSITTNNIENNAVYYIKAYDTSINKIKINPDVFNVSYITQQNSNNPTVTIDGRSYPTIPFSDLSSTANQSTASGYIPGASCQLGDLNCQASVTGMDISDLFTHPLELLKDMWSAIVSVFTVITAFIVLLPMPLQAFMYSAFMFAVVLGLLKIIL